MPAPSLRIPLSLNMGEFDQNIEKARSVTATATRFITKQFIDMNASVLATQGATGAAVLGFRSVLGAIGPLALAIGGIVGVFKTMAYATELAKDKIEEFNEIADKASKANVSTDFFQRFTKSGQELRLTVEKVNEALERFNNLSRDALGGSALGQRVDELKKAGNFENNPGVASLANATTTEDKLRSTVELIGKALDSGERLAGLDIAQKAFGPEITDRLRQDSGFLDQMLATASKISAEKIISDEQVGQAIQLKQRLEDAQKVLADRFKPIQDDLAKLGVQYHQSWIEVLETIAGAVGKANDLYAAIKQVPGVLADLGNASFWTKLTEASEKLGLNSGGEGLIKRGQPGFEQTPGNAALAAGLSNPNAVQRAMQETIDVQTKVRRDVSKPPPAREQADVNDQYDRAIETLEKHTARLIADTDAVGLGAGALEEFRAKAQLLTAAQQAGVPVQGETAKKIDEISKAAGAAGEALARARVDSEIKFGAGTAFLSQEDVAIAQQLRTAYGNDIPAALASSQAGALRLVDANRQIAQTLSGNLSTGIVDVIDGTKTAGQAFQDFSKVAVRAIEEAIVKLLIVGPLLRALQSGLGGILGGSDPIGSFTVGTQSFPKFAAGTDFAPGGPSIVGEQGPEIVNLPRGAQVIPNNVASRMGGGNVNIVMIEDSSRAGQVEKRGNGNGGFDIDVFVDAITAKKVSDPGSATRQALGQAGRLASR